MKEKYWIIEEEGILPRNKEIANEFLQSLKLANKSEATIDKYRRVLEKFLGQCSKNREDLVADDVRNWLDTHYGDKKEPLPPI